MGAEWIVVPVTDPKPSVLFVLDQAGWAFDNIYRSIAPGLRSSWDVDAVFITDYTDLADFLDELLFGPKRDVVHFFWRTALLDLTTETVVTRLAERRQIPISGVAERFAAIHLSFSVYDHLFLEPLKVAANRPVFDLVDGYTVSSGILRAVYSNLGGYPPPAAETPDGVDPTFYYPSTSPEVMPGGTLRVGWVGNSRWGILEGITDAKGVHSILLPAMEVLRANGTKAELILLDRAQRWRSRAEVAEQYREMDVLVCVSLIEGTPNPVLEAMASGIAVVSTRVGIVPEVLGPLQQAFVIERTPQALADSLAILAGDQRLLASLGKENREQALQHAWPNRVATWLDFLERVRQTNGGEARKKKAFHAAMHRRNSSFKDIARSFFRRYPGLYRMVARLYHSVLLGAAVLRRSARRISGK